MAKEHKKNAHRDDKHGKTGSHDQPSGSSHSTTDHEEIRKWVESRGGFPASVVNTMSDDDPGMIRVDFPGYSGEESLERIEWDEWFEKFDEKGLQFLYQDKMSDGSPSRFWKLIYPESAKDEERHKKAS